jgi:hypothetical protein
MLGRWHAMLFGWHLCDVETYRINYILLMGSNIWNKKLEESRRRYENMSVEVVGTFGKLGA